MLQIDALLREYDRARAYTDDLWKDLTPDEVTWRPHENSSAIGWHLGHQAHVAHFMIRNLTAAEPSPDPELDGLMDSANPESFRGALPTIRRLTDFRTTVAERVHAGIGDIAVGRVGAPTPLAIVPPTCSPRSSTTSTSTTSGSAKSARATSATRSRPIPTASSYAVSTATSS
ncbi:DinB family protein [Streptomyces tailanensis]|uniref:DinB family protein n=1 Tax=Streptomyces tailanensis TaxID=2569858 RepID=UPI001FE91E30|nr:DinB family protein [Streptomyces tailanensis]